MKIKLFTRELVSDGIYEKFGFEKTRLENDEEFETRINDFMATHDIISVQYQSSTCGNYEDLGTKTTIMVVYQERG